jgi:hypothetical protein
MMVHPDASRPEQGVILVVEGAHPGPVTAGARLVTLRYAQVDAKVLGALLPDLIILPLFGHGFDAIDALQHFERLGYSGMAIVRGPVLPNRAIVERELSAMVPGLTVRLTGPMN